MVSPDSRANLARRQAEVPLSALCKKPSPALSDMRGRSLNGSLSDAECRLTQFAQYLGRVETAYTVFLQYASNSRFRRTEGLLGCRCGFPQVEHPILIQIAELQHLGVIAPELIP